MAVTAAQALGHIRQQNQIAVVANAHEHLAPSTIAISLLSPSCTSSELRKLCPFLACRLLQFRRPATGETPARRHNILD